MNKYIIQPTNLIETSYITTNYKPSSVVSHKDGSERNREVNVVSSRCPKAFLWVWVGEDSGLTKSRKINGKYNMGEKEWVTDR